MKIPWRYLPPNLATFASVCLSVAAIRTGQLGDVVGASWLVMLSMLVDKVDGSLARALKAQSRFGVEMDSFADFVAFGLTPGLLMMQGQEQPLSFASAPALLYIGCCLARLVRFNVVDAGNDGFRGLPSTASGGLMALAIILGTQYDVAGLPTLLNVVAVVLGLAMVSAIPLPKPGRSGSRVLDIIFLVGLLTAAVLIITRELPEVILGIATVFLTTGLIVGQRQRMHASDAVAG